MIKSLIKMFLGSKFPTITKVSSRGVKYTKIDMPRRNLKYYAPHYNYARFKEMYRSLYAVNPMLVEELFQEYEKTFCGGDNGYLIVKNFIIGYQLLNGVHIVAREYGFRCGLIVSESQVDQLRLDFPGYQFRFQKDFDGEKYLCVIYTGNDIPESEILSVHNKLGSK